MNPSRTDDQCPTSAKLELVLRLLRGERLEEVAREVGRPQRQLVAWRQRFLDGGEAYLDARPNPRALEELEQARGALAATVAELEVENRSLARRLAVADGASTTASATHPFCSRLYADALEEPGVWPLHVPEWGTYVLVRDGRAGARQANGIRPLASLDPDCDLRAGLETLRAAGVTSVSIVTDPLHGPDGAVLQREFEICQVLKRCYLIDRDAERVHISKRHRNRINKAGRVAEAREVTFADVLPRWLELYERNVATREIPQPYSQAYFERLADLPGLRTVAVLVDDEVATITVWMRYRETLYFLDSASSVEGHEASASYVAFANVVDTTEDCRHVFLGGSADFYDDDIDGLARFKRGFSNASVANYICGARLNAPAPSAAGA